MPERTQHYMVHISVISDATSVTQILVQLHHDFDPIDLNGNAPNAHVKLM